MLLGLLIVYRIGTYIPVPGIDASQLRSFFEQANTGIGGMLNMFTGGAVGRMAIFALGIMPYITSSIIMQLLASMVPQLEQLKKEGEQGRKKINQYTRYGTVVLAFFQAYGISVGLESQGLASDPGWYFRASCIITLVGGTMFLMWLGEQITARGIGNGISLIIFVGIVAELPSALAQFFASGRSGIISPYSNTFSYFNGRYSDRFGGLSRTGFEENKYSIPKKTSRYENVWWRHFKSSHKIESFWSYTCNFCFILIVAANHCCYICSKMIVVVYYHM